MTREELLSRLSKLLSSQFEQVMYLARIPQALLPGATAAQMTRAVELLRYVEQQNQLELLAGIVDQVDNGGGQASSDPSVTPFTSPDWAGIDFTAERARHARFVGRTALLAQLDQLLIEESVDRWVVVTVGPGMGKSALLAQWLARREAAGDRVPHHFIRRGEYDWDDPATLASSLVAQIVARFPDRPEPEREARMHPATRLRSALQRVSQHELVPRGERLVVLIDGLDEYDPPADGRPGSLGRDPLADFLPHILPSGVSFLCASRPRYAYVDMLMARGAQEIDLDSDNLAADNTATVQAFWEQAMAELGLDAQFIAKAVDRAAGNPQHAEMLRKRLVDLPPDQRRVEDIPRGLAALLARAWDRIAIDPAVMDGLGVLCVAREPLTLDELAVVADWSSAAPRRTFMHGARELLIESQRANGVAEYRLHHDAIRVEVGRALGEVVLRAHHHALTQRLATWPVSVAAARTYALHHALRHRIEVGAWEDAWSVAGDVTYLEAKCREVGVSGTTVELARTAALCRASGDEVGADRHTYN